jgi:hypothetical protein
MFSMFSMYLGIPKVAYERPLGLMFLLRELGFFFITRTDDSKTQVPSFCQKKGPKSPKFFQLGSFFSA